jgi:LysM repeat protein
MAITSEHGTSAHGSNQKAGKGASRLSKNLFNTIPIVLAGTMALALNVTAPIHPEAKRVDKLKPSPSEPGKADSAKAASVKNVRKAFAAASRASTNPTATTTSAPATEVSAVVPTTYTVAAGDTISSIAGRYGLATASVLALNGLGWKSVIYPGQKLTLSKTGAVAVVKTSTVTPTTRYTILTGDTISRIAAKFGLSTQTLLSANGLGVASIIYPGQTIAIPSTSATAAVAVAAKPIAATPVASTSVGSGTSYVIKSGDSIAAIAAKFGVTTQAILTANGLNWSSIIYSGKTLTIPTLAIVTTSSVTPSAVLTPEMKANALTIIRVGKSLGVPSYGLVIALAAAAQESGLRNLTYGDRDSLGLFQQRPSAGWGSRAQLLDPTYAAKLFYGGAKNPNVGNTRGLLDIPGWQSMSVTQAAQAVQLSGYPTAYAKWETAARTWVATIG